MYFVSTSTTLESTRAKSGSEKDRDRPKRDRAWCFADELVLGASVHYDRVNIGIESRYGNQACTA